MKKILSLLLAAVCVFAMVACTGPSVEQMFNDSDPTKIVTIVEYVGKDTLVSSYVTEIDKENDKALLSYEIARYGVPENGDADRIVKENGKIYYKNGAITANEGESWQTAVDLAPVYKLNMNPLLFDEYVEEDGGKKIVGKVKGDSIKSVLGVPTFDESDEISITVTTNGVYVYGIEVSYKVGDAKVFVRTSYTYAPITLDF